ncbi:alpha/beta fold hydrolase [Rhodococcus sp. MEB041]|uniref:alpha/beta hydrolase n=1 Tax=Rhodococcus sp. MEB041 TaxID=3040323 RepID=UPI00254F2F54|nr:alpha/beta fold hydrolase [Rhodococcus sp. MEB041]
MHRENTTFAVDGETVDGWYFVPDAAPPHPVVIIAEGLGGVKEMSLDRVGRSFAEAGFGVLAFDYLNFGSSTGPSPQLVDPEQQVRTFRAAIDVARARPDVDRLRVGAWGASFGGGHVLRLASTDTTIASAVAVVPHLGVPRSEALRNAVKPTTWRAMVTRSLTLVSAGPADPALLQDRDAYEFLTGTAQRQAPQWRNDIASASLPRLGRYTPVASGSRLRVPTRVIVATDDTLNPASRTRKALPTTDTIEVPGGHFDIYGSSYESMIGASLDWFRTTMPA